MIGHGNKLLQDEAVAVKGVAQVGLLMPKEKQR